MKVSKEVREAIQELFRVVYLDPKLTTFERTVIYAVSGILFSYMDEE